ncbi:MAG: hypothetical protein ACE37F_31685 [Nannocystaceae bacterium]|nr:hypothetical protein [bacterium]
MLVDCPECEHRVSDRAAACPQCGFPIAAELAAQREREAAEADRTQRERVGDVDCAICDARGFTTEGPEDRPTAFSWCETCKHSGRVPLVKSPKGYWAVGFASEQAFLQGEELRSPNAVYLGDHAPEGHRYPEAGPRRDGEDDT